MHRFLDNQGGHGNVVFNFRSTPVDDLPAFAEGYHEAGRALAQKLEEARGYADYEGYPILYLYRHALELYLKAVVYRGAILLGLISEENIDLSGLFTSHELGRLLPPIRKIWKAQKWDFDGTQLSSFDDFEELIHSLDQIDPKSFSFRYPVSRSGNAQLPHHFSVNVVSFANNMDGLLNLLEGAAIGLTEKFELEAEARYELYQYVNDYHTT